MESFRPLNVGSGGHSRLRWFSKTMKPHRRALRPGRPAAGAKGNETTPSSSYANDHSSLLSETNYHSSPRHLDPGFSGVDCSPLSPSAVVPVGPRSLRSAAGTTAACPAPIPAGPAVPFGSVTVIRALSKPTRAIPRVGAAAGMGTKSGGGRFPRSPRAGCHAGGEGVQLGGDGG